MLQSSAETSAIMNLTFALMTASVYLMSCIKFASQKSCPLSKGRVNLLFVVLETTEAAAL